VANGILCKVIRCKYGDFLNTLQIFFNIFFELSTECMISSTKCMANFLKVANLTCFSGKSLFIQDKKSFFQAFEDFYVNKYFYQHKKPQK